jgi:hypothetical protein
VSGELAQREDTWKLLVGRQKRPVQILPSPMESPEGFPSNQYATNIGLALKNVLSSERGAVSYSLVNFNALPEIYIPKSRPLSEILFVPTIVVGIALVALGVYFNINASAHTAALRAEMAAINQMAISQQARDKEISSLGKQVSSVEATAKAFTTTLGEFSAGRDKFNDDLSQINESLSVGG